MDDFETIYKETRYIVEDGRADFTILLAGDNKAVHEFLTEARAKTWAFLTACNPFGGELSNLENARRQQTLATILKSGDYEFYRGKGVGTDPAWQPEPSFFILDISRDAAIQLAKRFEQNAILWGSIDSPPELVWCA